FGNNTEVIKAPARPGQKSAWLHALPYCWGAGVIGYLVVIFACHRKFSTWLKRQPLLTAPQLLALIEEEKLWLKIRTRLWVYEADTTPSLFGAFKPRLLLP